MYKNQKLQQYLRKNQKIQVGFEISAKDVGTFVGILFLTYLFTFKAGGFPKG